MAANGFVDGCGFTAASSGIGDFVVSSAVVGYQIPSAANAVNGTIYSYRAESASRADWEIGFGVYTAGTTTLARTTVLYNSAGTTSKISFSAAPNVYITALTADLQNASLLSSGTVNPNRLGSGVVGSGAKFLADNSTFQTLVSTGRLLGFNPYASSQTITILTGATACFIRMVGGSAGAGGSNGGSGGGALEKYLGSITAGNTLSFTVGSSGAGTGGGGAGGSSVLSSGTQTITTLTATGAAANGGAAGTGTNGDANIKGQQGANATASTYAGGGMAGLGMGCGGFSDTNIGAQVAGTAGLLEIWWFS